MTKKSVRAPWAALSRSLGRRERGATMVEYAFIVIVIALVVVVGAAVLGSSLSSLYSSFTLSL